MRFLSLFALLLAVGSTAKPAQDVRTVWSGVYTEAQAAQGQAPYQESCSRCHAPDLSGQVGAALKGDVFIRDWGGKTVGAFYDRIKTTMPRGAAGSLSDTTYLNIVAYVLQVNGFPASPNSELKADQLQAIRVESKEGPGFIPNDALVDDVGCLVQRPDKVWTLEKATNIVRVLEAGPPKPEVLTAAGQKELGTGELRLLYIVPAPENMKGHKVYSKGFLIRDTAKGDAINVSSLQSLAPSC